MRSPRLFLAIVGGLSFQAAIARAAESPAPAFPGIEAVMDYVAQSPEFPGPPPGGRYALRLVGWDAAKGDFVIKHYLPPTPGERARGIQLEVADYLVSSPKRGDSGNELLLIVTPLGRSFGKFVPAFFRIVLDAQGHFASITRYAGY
jgi:hypothetical protein